MGQNFFVVAVSALPRFDRTRLTPATYHTAYTLPRVRHPMPKLLLALGLCAAAATTAAGACDAGRGCEGQGGAGGFVSLLQVLVAEATHQHEMVPVAAPSGAAANEDVPVFPCSQVLPTALDGKTFAHEAVKARPFCGRYVQIAESDNLLREGPAVCPNADVVADCKPDEVLTHVQVRVTVGDHGIRYFNCWTDICERQFSDR